MSFHELMVSAADANFAVAGKTVLEIASDPWLLSAKHFKKLGADRVIASDMYEGWQRISDEQIESIVLDARSIVPAIADSSVDLIFAINLLEHLSDIAQAICSMSEALKPGGMLFLHGHPIWTSARGHHVMHGYIGKSISFGTETDPIEKWSHLYMSREEMRSDLESKGQPVEAIEACLDWSFDTDHITRTPRAQIIKQLAAGCDATGLVNVGLWEDKLEPPTESDLENIRGGAWWNDAEDYSVRGMTVLLRKSTDA